MKMKPRQQMPTNRTVYSWILWHLRNRRDVAIELRAPKGYGKSSLMYHMIQRLVPGYQFQNSLCLNHKQYAKVVKAIRKIRVSEDRKDPSRASRSIQFVWADDATRLLNRRDALTKLNKRVLDYVRTSRNQIQAVQLLGTQDDLMERPMIDSGPYLLLLLEKPYEATICWPMYDEMGRFVESRRTRYKLRWPNPEQKYPAGWRLYQSIQAKLNDQLSQETLNALTRKPWSPGATPKVDYSEVRATYSKVNSLREAARIHGISHMRVSQIVNGRNA